MPVIIFLNKDQYLIIKLHDAFTVLRKGLLIIISQWHKT